jgi:hypothetical protein
MKPITFLDPTERVVLDTGERGSADLAFRHVRGVSTLLSTRDDLRGVHAWADVVEESVRWSA